ncbi:MAG: PorP/SprF family type IX secretion system membrane protein [Bacteroidia bacterium]
MKKIIFILSVCTADLLIAQDLHFSQYSETPCLVNPALTGTLYAVRASMIYRDQWRSVAVPYKTYNTGVEIRFKTSDWQKNGTRNKLTRVYKKGFSRFAAGLSVTSDRAGNGNMGLTQGNLALATFVPVDEKNTLSVGLLGGIVQRHLEIDKLSFPDQYDGKGGYSQSISSGENSPLRNFSYPDLSAGIMWGFKRNNEIVGGNNQVRSNLGFSVFHVNRPYLQFVANSNDRLSIKYILHADLLFEVPNTNIAILPSIVGTRQNTSTEILTALSFKYYLADDSKYTGTKKRSAVSIGAGYRSADALLFMGTLEYERYAIGISYDYTISRLISPSKGRGGAEIFLRFNSVSSFLFQTNRAKI